MEKETVLLDKLRFAFSEYFRKRTSKLMTECNDKKEVHRKIYQEWFEMPLQKKLSIIEQNKIHLIKSGNAFLCKTCTEKNGKEHVLCSSCACNHVGHDLEFLGTIPFKCDDTIEEIPKKKEKIMKKQPKVLSKIKGFKPSFDFTVHSIVASPSDIEKDSMHKLISLNSKENDIFATRFIEKNEEKLKESNFVPSVETVKITNHAGGFFFPYTDDAFYNFITSLLGRSDIDDFCLIQKINANCLYFASDETKNLFEEIIKATNFHDESIKYGYISSEEDNDIIFRTSFEEYSGMGMHKAPRWGRSPNVRASTFYYVYHDISKLSNNKESDETARKKELIEKIIKLQEKATQIKEQPKFTKRALPFGSGAPKKKLGIFSNTKK